VAFLLFKWGIGGGKLMKRMTPATRLLLDTLEDKYNYNGQIELIIGPMFSMKTTTLISKIERYLIAKKSVIALKWAGDTRYTNDPYIITHSGLKCKCIPCDNKSLATIYHKIKDNEIICIDEGAFFDDIVSFCEDLANRGHHVIVASLIGTYQREGFGDIPRLATKCEKIIMLDAVCMKCYKDGAAFTKRIIEPTSDKFEVQIGGAETYLAVCRKCFYIK